ncbi:DNA repair protein XRCC2-like [Melanaphis sacchari]|uniref:DNA repair protein XRCC2-like n=1 Tax=Melanaphis sacchari TaxID=742174 RepID=UPI000DC13E69|nr:DNA repair protein XRCC2-like [Melanaphis sacchari]
MINKALNLKQFMQRQKTLRLYREFLKTIKNIPLESDRQQFYNWVKEDFKKNKFETDEVCSIQKFLENKVIMEFKSQAESGLQLLERLVARPIIKNLSPLLPDELTSETIELIGNASTGKTLFLTECVAKCITPQNFNGLDTGVVYIDLDGQFSITKLVKIIKRLIKNIDDKLLKFCLNKLTLINCFDSPTLYVTFQRLKLFLTEQSQVGLVILDSVSANYWQDSVSGGEKYIDTYVEKMISSLKICLEDFKVPIIFTRQSYFQSKKSDSLLDCVNRKIEFKRLDSDFYATVTRKNLNLCYKFSINEQGIGEFELQL